MAKANVRVVEARENYPRVSTMVSKTIHPNRTKRAGVEAQVQSVKSIAKECQCQTRESASVSMHNVQEWLWSYSKVAAKDEEWWSCREREREREKGIIRKVAKQQQKSKLLTETDAKRWWRWPPMITTRLMIGGRQWRSKSCSRMDLYSESGG